MTYWDNYYSNKIIGDNALVGEPSSFARFTLGFLRCHLPQQRDLNVVDLGCGNGRDAAHFDDCGMKVTAVDRSRDALRLIPREGIAKLCCDMSDLADVEQAFHLAYMRFSLHAVEKKVADCVLQWVARNLLPGGCLAMEARSVNDPRYGAGQSAGEHAFVDSHYRRFIDLDQLTAQLATQLDLEILHAEENWSDAHHGDDKAVVVRVIARNR